jgi:ankyrin repeat protein
LLAAGADPDFFNQDRDTPLQAAAENNHIVIVRLLLDCGALINEQSVLNWFSESALHHAVAENNIEIVQLLIERGADVNQRARRQASPLLLASMRGHLKMVQLLVEKGAEVRFGDDYGSDDNALYHAVDRGHYDVARYLLEKGADVHQREGFRGFTPLHAAAVDGNSDLVKLLLKYKAGDSGIPTEDWNEQIPCPVGLAAEGRHQEVLRILVQHEVDIDCCGEDELTALQIASTEGDFEMVRFLLEHGADINRTGGNTVATPLDLALEKKHDRISQYLREKGAKTGSEIWHGQ